MVPKMSIAVSARTRSFFFTNERDNDKVTKERADIINQMQLTHVGFWIRGDIQYIRNMSKQTYN